MDARVNDIVRYGPDVCKISGVQDEVVGGNRMQFYILNPVYDESIVIYAPVDSEYTTSKMQRVLTQEEVDGIIQAMASLDTIWIDDEKSRTAAYKQIIARGDRLELASLIKTLFVQQTKKANEGKKLYAVDERFMNDAQRALHGEIAYVMNIKPDQVVSYIERHFPYQNTEVSG